MQNSPLVSIVLPTFNRAEVLPRAINSVFSQTFSDWELIIWDDGSTDSTAELLHSYSDDRLYYYFDSNHGAAYARNRALDKAKGKFIAFLDSDDEWLAGKLIAQMEVMEIYSGIELIFTNFLNKNGASLQVQPVFEQYSNVMMILDVEKIDSGLNIIKHGLLESLAVDNYIATDTVFVRREVLERVGLFREDLRNAEDFELWWRMGLADVRFAFLEREFLIRHKSSETLSASSILAGQNKLKALDICSQNSLTLGRSNILPWLNNSYRNAWQNMIRNYGRIGDNYGMIHAFSQSLKYGFKWGTLRLFLEGHLRKSYQNH